MADIKFPQDTVAATLADGDLFLFADVSTSNALKEVAASDLGIYVQGEITALNATAIANGSVSSAEFQYLDGVTSAIQTQLDGKASSSHTHTLVSITDVTSSAAELNILDGATLTVTELNYVDGVTSAIQTQLNGKSATGHTHVLANITDAGTLAAQNLIDNTDLSTTIITGLVADASPDGAADYIMTYDASGTALKKVLLDNLPGGAGGTIDGSGTTNEITYWVDSNTLGALAVATYPSLTEIAYTKGVTSAIQTQIDAKESALTFSTGLTRATNTITNDLSTGVSGGQTAIGGTASGNDLTLSSTSNATKGKILLGASAYDEVNNRLGIGTVSPTHKVEIVSGAALKFRNSTLDGFEVVQLNTKSWGWIGLSASMFFNLQNSDFIVTEGKIGVGTGAGVTPAAKIHSVSTTEQLRTGYDASNYLSTTINSTGSATLNLVGTSPEFTFSDPVNVPDEAYGAGWNGNTEVPTKNAVYDKIETLGGGSGITRTVASIAINTTAGATAVVDYVYFATATLTLTLPTAVGNTNRYTIKCVAGTLTVDGAGAETIDGSANIIIAVEDSVDLISNNTERKVV